MKSKNLYIHCLAISCIATSNSSAYFESKYSVKGCYCSSTHFTAWCSDNQRFWQACRILCGFASKNFQNIPDPSKTQQSLLKLYKMSILLYVKGNCRRRVGVYLWEEVKRGGDDGRDTSQLSQYLLDFARLELTWLNLLQ